MIGALPAPLLESLLETIPLEFSIIDADDNVLAWNKHESRLFKRPMEVVGRNVRMCHPQHSLQKVEAILDEMKAGAREQARFWIQQKMSEELPPQTILIDYYALRGADGAYLGCMECSRNVTDIKVLEGEKRLLD